MRAAFVLVSLAASDLAACDRDDPKARPPLVPERPATMPPDQTPAMDVSEGLSSPESILVDTDADVYLVSNINGAPHAKDDNGYISILSPDGRVLTERFIDGSNPAITLDGPRGMAIHDGALYVVDVDALRVFDRRTGTQRASWPIPDAHFPNDVRVDADGNIWVTETGIYLTPRGPTADGTPAIWRFTPDGTPTKVASGPELAGPNGIALTPKGPVLASFMGFDVYRLVDGRPVPIATLPKSWLDGLVQLPDGSLLVTSWQAHGIYQVFADGSYRLAYQDASLVGAASIDFDVRRSRVLIPLVLSNLVRFEPYSPLVPVPAVPVAGTPSIVPVPQSAGR